jgi:UDP-N-acetyl-D-galactosamine dehydrogenase
MSACRLALAFGRQLNTIGFDISEPKLKAYREGFDPTGEDEPRKPSRPPAA